MNVVRASEMARLEQLAIAVGCSDKQFMEAAGQGIAELIEELYQAQDEDAQIVLLCGKGNNGGDAYAAGCHLFESEHHLLAYQLAPLEHCTPLCRAYHDRFVSLGGEVIEVSDEEELRFSKDHLILDGIFGTGFRGSAEGLFAAAIARANASGAPIIAIDIPSGLNGDTGEVGSRAIKAALTFYLGLPKTGFFLGEGWNHVGGLRLVDFGLPPAYVDAAKAEFLLLEHQIALELLPPIVRTRHKYQTGYVVAAAGSLSMPGAAILSCYAALRAGAGVVRLLHPPGMQPHALGLPPEVLASPWDEGEEALLRANALLAGPGLGHGQGVRSTLLKMLHGLECPCVIDADALNILAKEREVSFPRQTIITPHRGEFARLLGGPVDLLRAREYVEEKQVVCVLKGAPSFVLIPEPSGLPWIIPTGNPGMATAGCGDVLTGIIAALLAQGLRPAQAALLGTYLHGLAGDIAALEITERAMIASDVIESLPQAFMALR